MADSQPTAVTERTRLQPLRAEWASRYEIFVFCGLTLCGLIPIWATGHFPSIDGPAHLALVHIWTHYEQADAVAFREFFEIGVPAAPNLFIYLVLYPLTKVLSPFAAEQVLLSVYVIGFPLAVRYAVNAIDGNMKAMSILAIPLTYNFLLNFGFYNFLFGAVVFCIVFGYWYRHRMRFRARDYVICAGLSVLAFFTHLSSIALIAIAIALFSVGEAQLAARAATGGARVRAGAFVALLVNRARTSIVALSPGLLLVALYAWQTTNLMPQLVSAASAGPAAEVSQFGLLLQRILARGASLLYSSVLSPLSPAEIFIGLIFSAVCISVAAIAVVRRRAPDIKRVDALVVMFAGIVVLYLLAPFAIQVRWIPDRLQLYVLIVAVLVLAGQVALATDRWRRWCHAVVLVLLPLLVVPSILFKVGQYRQVEQLTAEYLTASDHIEPGSSVLALRLQDADATGAEQISYATLIQGGSYFVMLNNAVDVKIVQAHSPVVPVRYRDHKTTYNLWAGDSALVATPPRMDLANFRAAMGADLDYVILWGRTTQLGETPEGTRLLDQLDRLYRLVHMSSESGLLHVYRRR